MDIRPIHTPQDHETALARVDALMDMNDGNGPMEDSDEAAELDILSALAERYEDETFPMDLPTPVEAVRFVMDQQGYGQQDLANLLHSRSRASELLSGKLKGLSRAMMQRLHDEWRIPAEILIRDCG